jgi:glycosyltransferase involved in cell wall biosynthesis
MKIHWVHQHTGVASAFGYSTFARKLVMELVKKDVVYFERSPVSIQMVPPYYFRRVRFRKNVLFTMFEFDKIPEKWNTLLDRADLVIVPCTQNQKVFSEATNTKVEICPGGVDAALFPYVEREEPELFTFLFLGDYNPRKGTYHVAQAWELWNARYPELAKKSQLIMKMTSYDEKRELRQVTQNSYFDFRVLPLTEKDSERTGMPTLGALYEYAHCFLWPTMGEGWGLPLCEAMSSGLPCIYTPYAYPVEYKAEEIVLVNPFNDEGHKVNAASPVIESIVDRMHEIFVNYEQALEKGKLAAQIMRQRFGWDKAADAFIDIIKRNYPEVA